MLRNCGTELVYEKPEDRVKLAHGFWDQLMEIGEFSDTKEKKMWTFFPGFTYSNTILQCMQLLSDRVLKPSDDSSVYFIHTSLRNVSLH